MRRRLPLPLDEIVRAQNLACAGASVAEIALELGRPAHEIAVLIDPDAGPRAAQPQVTRGFADLKNHYR